MKLNEIFGGRPLVWELAANLKAKGDKLGFHAHLPGSSTYVVGWLEGVSGRSFRLWIPAQRKRLQFSFTEIDDEKLTIRPSDSELFDYMVVDVK